MGFSPDWLALREPADRAARDGALARRAAALAGPAPLIVDLGCGTGASWRALAPLLPGGTRWRFVDHDPELLARAGEAAGAGAELVKADLGEPERLPLADASLVTASALLDLVPERWVTGLARRLEVPFYAALSYDGRMEWSPGEPRDAAVTAAFNRHQRADKGLGPALGPEAARRTVALLEDAGFAVETADSPWHLGADAVALQRELTAGIAAAAAEAGEERAPAWGRHRCAVADRTLCVIGHLDLLAIPGGPRREAGDAAR